MADRYQRAAQDGNLQVLRETTRKDCNMKDEDGMTPTLWAAFEGNVDALRLLIGRGGDPEKSDNYGNTALHLASARGHMSCVTYLVNFGVNLWSQDIDQHTPQELAAMNDCHDILRYLDTVCTQMDAKDAGKVAKMKKKAEKEAQELQRNFKKVQDKADNQSKQWGKKQQEERVKMAVEGGRKDSIAVHQANLSFSDMVGIKGNNANGGSKPRTTKMIGTVFKRAQVQKKKAADIGFKVREIEDGKLSVRELSGLRRGSEILFVAPKDTTDNGTTNGDYDNDGGSHYSGNSSSNHLRPPSSPAAASMIRRDTFGIFDRPGFGQVAFRRDSMATTLHALAKDDDSAGEGEDDDDEEDERDGGGGGRQVNGKQHNGNKVAASASSAAIDEPAAGFGGAIDMFLAGLGLQSYINVFRRQKIDLDTLMLLTEQNLLEMSIEIGPRKKIMKAIDERRKDLEGDEAIEDSRL